MADFEKPLADDEQETALAAAASSAQRFLLSRRAFRASVVSADATVESYQRALHQFERRKLTLNHSPGGTGDRSPIPDPATADPWGFTPATIESDTRSVVTCSACNGNQVVDCPTCKGTMEGPCPHCSGGYTLARRNRRGDLVKPCGRCHGRNRARGTCPTCRNGQVGCGTCAAKGSLTVWFSMERTFRSQVNIHPANAVSKAHANIQNPTDFDRAEGYWINRLVSDSGSQASIQIPVELKARVNGSAERVTTSRLQKFSAKVHRFSFVAARSDGCVEVLGIPPLISSATHWGGAAVRLAAILGIASVGFLGAGALESGYLGQHLWFQRYGNVPTVLGLWFCAALFLALTLGEHLLVKKARSSVVAGVAWFSLLCLVGGTALSYQHLVPSALAARKALTAGDFPRAELEGQALVELGMDRSNGADILDDIYLSKIKSSSDAVDAAHLYRHNWQSPEKQKSAQLILQQTVEKQGQQLFQSRNSSELEEIANAITDLLPSDAAGIHWLSMVLDSDASVGGGDLSAATKQLQEIIESGKNVPQSLKPYNFIAVLDAATHLVKAVRQVDAQHSLRGRSRALTAANESAKTYAATIGTDPQRTTAALAASLEKAKSDIARAEHEKRLSQKLAREATAQALKEEAEARALKQEAEAEARRDKAQQSASRQPQVITPSLGDGNNYPTSSSEYRYTNY